MCLATRTGHRKGGDDFGTEKANLGYFDVSAATPHDPQLGTRKGLWGNRTALVTKVSFKTFYKWLTTPF